MLTVGSLTKELGLELAAGSGRRRRARDPLGPHLRAARPDPLALRRRAAADHRDPARHRRAASASSSGCSPTASVAGLGLRHRASTTPSCPRPLVTEAETSSASRVFEVPYEMPVHRHHRGGVQPARERAVRRALPRDRRQRAARAAGPRGRRARGDRPRDRLRGRRQLGRARRRAASRWRHGGRRLAAEHARRASATRSRPRGAAAAPFVPSSAELRGRALAHPVSPRGGARRGLARGRAPLRRARATSSASACSRPRSWSPSS